MKEQVFICIQSHVQKPPFLQTGERTGNSYLGMSKVRISTGLTKNKQTNKRASKLTHKWAFIWNELLEPKFWILYINTGTVTITTEACDSTHRLMLLMVLAKSSPFQKSCKRTVLHLQNIFSLQISTLPVHSPQLWKMWIFLSNTRNTKLLLIIINFWS